MTEKRKEKILILKATDQVLLAEYGVNSFLNNIVLQSILPQKFVYSNL